MGKQVSVKIKELSKKNGMSLREFSNHVDVRHAALSELSNKKRKSISFEHIEKIADSLGISDIREIIDLEDKKE